MKSPGRSGRDTWAVSRESAHGHSAALKSMAHPKGLESNVDAFNVVVGIIGIIAFTLALWQYFEHRRIQARNNERLESQERLSRRAAAIAVNGAQLSNNLVQRSKLPSVTVDELQNLARITRQQLLTLAADLTDQATVLEAWRLGKQLDISEGRSSHPVEIDDAPNTP